MLETKTIDNELNEEMKKEALLSIISLQKKDGRILPSSGKFLQNSIQLQNKA